MYTNGSITLYDLTGRKVAEAKAVGGKAMVDTSNLSGVYVVKAGGKTVKVSIAR